MKILVLLEDVSCSGRSAFVNMMLIERAAMLNMFFNEQPQGWNMEDMSFLPDAALGETSFF